MPCHRLFNSKHNKIRLIIVRFDDYNHCEVIWKSLNKLKTTKYYISKDFPSEIIYNRRKMLPIFSRARKHSDIKKASVTLKGDILTIDSAEYSVKSIKSLPENLNPSKFCNKHNEDTHLFRGIFSEHCALSNYGKFPFTHENQEFESVEHAHVYQKCVEARDMESAKKVLQVPEPYQAKRIGQQLKNLI